MSTGENWPEDRNRPEDRPDPFAEPPRKQGMSTGVKILLIVLVLGGIALLACCGVMAWFGSQVKMDQTVVPAEIDALREEIVSIEIPEGFAPQVGMNMDVKVMTMKMVSYAQEETAGSLVLAQMKMPAQQGAQNEQQMQQQLEMQMRQQNMGAEEIDIESSESRTFQIKGRDVRFTFAKGKEPDSGTEFRRVHGAFPGNDGTAFLQLQMEEEAWDEDAVVRMIESIGQ